MAATIDFGIDLGTTNSSIALCRRGDVRVFQSSDLMNVTPSVVYVSKTGRMLVGRKAYDTWTQDPENTQAEFKRWMGFNDRLTFPASGKQLSAEELSAEVLKSLRADAERQTQERIDAAVITVPAAFGTLQCDATGRAARMAGFEQFALLQEPIAAAIAYGASPDAQDQRWMVFDLGGGTLDIAIVSTRNSRLAVLEHQGNNRLGGKDIDRVIAESLLLAPLAQSYRLPNPKDNAPAYNRLMRALVRQAEQAKILLSSAVETTVDLFDIGEDLDGKPIEATIALKRSDVESKLGPILDQCLDLAQRALSGARISGTDLDRVLLVGGPTQMPMIRSVLADGIGAKLDYSQDPMVVVSHGAALFASTQEKTVGSATAPAQDAAAPAGKSVLIQLAYERASGSRQSPVAGVIEAKSAVHEVKIDAAGGFWTSGWIAVVNGCFQTDVMLHNTRPATNFSISARDAKGNAVAVDPAEFTITYMLPMAAPPLPHTIAIELSTATGQLKYDPIFERHCPLPAEVRKTYKAERTLRPSEIDSKLPIKFWEIEVSEDPQERWWAGSIQIHASAINRPIVEGSDLELTIKIDASRKISVEVFIPMLNDSISGNVYVPDLPNAREQLQLQIDQCFERLDQINRTIYELERPDLSPEYEKVLVQAEDIVEQIELRRREGGSDPDGSLEPVRMLRQVRMALLRLEMQLGIGVGSTNLLRDLRSEVPYIGRRVQQNGTPADRERYKQLKGQYERYSEVQDVRGLIWVSSQLWALHKAVVKKDMSFWQGILRQLKEPPLRFTNREEAAKHVAEAEAANARGDVDALREACNRAWALKSATNLEMAVEQAAQSGLKA